MGSVEVSYCSVEMKPCIGWVKKYFKDCLCNLNDEVSFGLGIISLICWGIAEIPQIVTNFKNKSSSGVSLAFLCTWIVGYVASFLSSFSVYFKNISCNIIHCFNYLSVF